MFFVDKHRTWNAKCPIFKAIVAGFRGKVALKKWDTWRSREFFLVYFCGSKW